MRREELTELHYITPIANVPSIMARGILSHTRVAQVPHRSVAMEEVQATRQGVILPNGRRLHDYVNLYLHARNPMMFKRKAGHETLCVLRISTDVLDLPGVILTDRNAAAKCRFMRSPHGLETLDHDKVFAEDWRHLGNWAAYVDHKAVKCAEALVPDHVNSEQIVGAYTSCSRSADVLRRSAPTLTVTVDGHMFLYTGG